MSHLPAPSHPEKPRRFTVARTAGLLALAAVLTASFIGHLAPSMRVQWANFVALCGF